MCNVIDGTGVDFEVSCHFTGGGVRGGLIRVQWVGWGWDSGSNSRATVLGCPRPGCLMSGHSAPTVPGLCRSCLCGGNRCGESSSLDVQ